MRTPISVDIRKKVILGWKISQKTNHEINHANALIGQSSNTRKSECYVMDKGYSSEKTHYLIKENTKANSIIPLRVRKRKKIGRRYGKQLYLIFDSTEYNKRNIVETIFSVVKRKFGDTFRAEYSLTRSKK